MKFARKGLIFSLFLCLGLGTLHAQQNASRGLILDLGIGPAKIMYGDSLGYIEKQNDGIPGVDRIVLSLDAGLGFATSALDYFMLTVTGTADRFYNDAGNSIQTNLYLFGAKIRHYPYVTGLFMEVGGAAARCVVQFDTRQIQDTWMSEMSIGGLFSLGYDFASNPTGFSLSLRAQGQCYMIEDEIEYSAALLASLTWK